MRSARSAVARNPRIGPFVRMVRRAQRDRAPHQAHRAALPERGRPIKRVVAGLVDHLPSPRGAAQQIICTHRPMLRFAFGREKADPSPIGLVANRMWSNCNNSGAASIGHAASFIACQCDSTSRRRRTRTRCWSPTGPKHIMQHFAGGAARFDLPMCPRLQRHQRRGDNQRASAAPRPLIDPEVARQTTSRRRETG